MVPPVRYASEEGRNLHQMDSAAAWIFFSGKCFYLMNWLSVHPRLLGKPPGTGRRPYHVKGRVDAKLRQVRKA